MIFRQYKFLTLLLVIGVIGAVWILIGRHNVEMENRRVEISVDYAEVAEIAGASNVPVSEALNKLKAAGATSVAVQEQTYADLAAKGEICVVPYHSGTLIKAASFEVAIMMSRMRSRMWGGTTIVKVIPPDVAQDIRSQITTIKLSQQPDFVLLQPVGLQDDAIEAAQEADMPVVARIVNHPGIRKYDIQLESAMLIRNQVKTVIFAEDEVLGFRGGVKDVSRVFKNRGLTFGMVEFAKQKGEQKLAEGMMPNVVRVHSITAEEMGTLDRPTAVERFAKAARERDVRLVYVRMFDLGSTNPLQTNIDYISSIKNRLIAQGLGVGVCRPFSQPESLPFARFLIWFGLIAAMLLLISRTCPSLFNDHQWFSFGLSMLVAGLPLILIMRANGAFASKLIALIAALVFPTLAIVYAASGSPEESTNKPLRTYLWLAVARFIGVIAISGAGGLMIAALLSRQEFMLRIDQFAGVKFAHILPILAVALAFTAGIAWKPGSWQEQKELAKSNLSRLFAQPVLVWQTALAGVLLVMVAIVLARSGNDSGVGISSLELRFRSILDTLLFVRPRTKEFLIGHPALFLGIAAALGGRRTWAALLLVIGMIGEVSLVNTFCHIHTPIEISIARTIIGAIIGLVIGIMLLLVFSRSKMK